MMKLYCFKSPDKEIPVPEVCKIRNRNKKLIKCYGCPGPVPKPEDVISQNIVKLLDKEKPQKPGDVFRRKEHKKELIKKYGPQFYNNL